MYCVVYKYKRYIYNYINSFFSLLQKVIVFEHMENVFFLFSKYMTFYINNYEPFQLFINMFSNNTGCLACHQYKAIIQWNLFYPHMLKEKDFVQITDGLQNQWDIIVFDNKE